MRELFFFEAFEIGGEFKLDGLRSRDCSWSFRLRIVARVGFADGGRIVDDAEAADMGWGGGFGGFEFGAAGADVEGGLGAALAREGMGDEDAEGHGMKW